jgi:hypothetical protein
MARPLELEELVEHFTLYPDESALLRNKSGATRLGFSLSLKFLLWKARFPRGRGELPDNAVRVHRRPGLACPPPILASMTGTGGRPNGTARRSGGQPDSVRAASLMRGS